MARCWTDTEGWTHRPGHERAPCSTSSLQAARFRTKRCRGPHSQHSQPIFPGPSCYVFSFPSDPGQSIRDLHPHPTTARLWGPLLT